MRFRRFCGRCNHRRLCRVNEFVGHPERSEGSREPTATRDFEILQSLSLHQDDNLLGNNMRRILIPVICLFALLSSNPAQAGWRDWVSPSKNWQRIKNCCRSTSDAVTGYCHRKVERAKADQAKLWGLKLPPNLDQERPLVVLIHGLDSDSGVWSSMAKLLEDEHYQVAYFGFPSDGPIQDDADRLASEMAALHEAFPRLRVHLIGHSMGGLIARAYVEGGRYTQPVDHFIAIGPPNHGSPW